MGKMTRTYKYIHADAERVRNTHTLYDRVNNHPKKVRLGLQRGANESNSKRSCDIDPSYLQALFSMQRIISVSPADTSLP